MEAATLEKETVENKAEGDREVSFEQAKIDQADVETPKPKAQEKPEDVLDVIQPKKEPKVWVIGPPEAQRQYVQRPLGFLQKMQWFALVGEVLEKSLSGEKAMSLNSLFAGPTGRAGSLTMTDFQDADTFVQAVGKLLVYAPDFLVKSYCIWLNVPDYEHDFVGQIMGLPVEEGGLSDDDGMEMIEIFIDQNFEALDSFFREKISGLGRRVQQRMDAAQAGRESQPSKR